MARKADTIVDVKDRHVGIEQDKGVHEHILRALEGRGRSVD